MQSSGFVIERILTVFPTIDMSLFFVHWFCSYWIDAPGCTQGNSSHTYDIHRKSFLYENH